MLVRDVLSLKGSAIYSIDGAKPLRSAVRLMVEHDVGSLVITEADRMVGMLTFREVLQALHRAPASGEMLAGDGMGNDVGHGKPPGTRGGVRGPVAAPPLGFLPGKEGERLLGIVSFHDVA